MLKIKQITIKNFRSIQHLSIDVDNLNVLSGLNDVGKSNVLKALNLFFNNETDVGRAYDFDSDYCLNAPVVVKKAKTIEISLKIEIPQQFKDHGVVVWTKRWQRNGRFSETKSRKFSARSRAGILLQRIRYRYVPAVKSANYFKSLLGDLYVCLASDVSGTLVQKTKTYSEIIKKFTEQISKIVRDRFGVDSALEFPRDQSVIFRELQFMTGIENNKHVGLAYRGDGVQSIHIPAILQFIAEKDNELLASRSIPHTTIWGYEEPENGLEMKRCYELAENFHRISSGIQMFITSHSPAFYSLSKYSDVKVRWLTKDKTGFTQVEVQRDLNSLLGYMPLIAPYIEDKIKELESAKRIAKAAIVTDLPTIVVEGVTDKNYLSDAIKCFSPKMDEFLRDGRLRIYARKDCGGADNVASYAHAWKCAQVQSRLVVVLDKDEAGGSARRKIADLNCDRIRSIPLPPPSWIIDIYGRIVEKERFQYSIEALFGYQIWEMLLGGNLLKPRNMSDLCVCFSRQLSDNRTLMEIVSSDIPKNDQLYVKYEPRRDRKMDICSLIQKTAKGRLAEIYAEFEPLVNALEKSLFDSK